MIREDRMNTENIIKMIDKEILNYSKEKEYIEQRDTLFIDLKICALKTLKSKIIKNLSTDCAVA